MRILVLSKRQYMSRDLLSDAYGRFYEIPEALIDLGHKVKGIAFSYRYRSSGWTKAEKTGRIPWLSINIGRFIAPGLYQYFSQAQQVIEDFQPDVIWACSDSMHIIFACLLSKRSKIPFIADLYDNFESYSATHIPGVLPAYIKSCQAASGITTVSLALLNKVRDHYQVSRPLLLLENAIPDATFVPMEQRECRRRLGIPNDKKIVGTAGALTKDRGIYDLLKAYQRLHTNSSHNIRLALAGPRKKGIRFDTSPTVVDLGILKPRDVPCFFNALDVAVICNIDSTFGQYCFPQKFYEIIACNTPLIAANVGVLGTILSTWPQCRYEPGKPETLGAALTQQLNSPQYVDVIAPTWADQAYKLSNFLEQIVSSPKSSKSSFVKIPSINISN